MKIFSGIRPTGKLHIGHCLGVIKQWLELQAENECVFCIVDWHAITTPYEPEKLQENVKETALTYLSLGLDPEKCILFVQSSVKEHTELAWILDTIVPVAELFRMTQYKEKSQEQKESPNMGLLNYPVLMAADILLYNTEIVPVGEDQVQHVELARTIAKKLNNKFGKTFILPKPRLTKGARIMSFKDPTKKMSKSHGEKSYISLFEEPGSIRGKVMTAVTDAGSEIKYNPKTKPGISNLLDVYSIVSGLPIEQIEQNFQGKGYSQFKESLANCLVQYLAPFKKKREEILKKQGFVEEILTKGAKKAQAIAGATMERVRKNAGLA